MTCYSPRCLGKKDILIAGERIYKIRPPGSFIDDALMETVLDCSRMLAFPGIIDQHVHIIGGGGEEGFASRLPEMEFQEIIRAGVTTVVGLLGADNQTKSLEALLAKARALELQGITASIYTGSYTLPPVTLTNSIISDLTLIDKVIGAGEIALSDHRSSTPDLNALIQLASETHMGGLIGGKAGVLHLHIGDGKEGLGPLLRLVGHAEYPIEEFVPTHVNRNPALFEQARDYLDSGGNIDLTAGESAGIPVPDAIEKLLQSGTELSRVTISSDAGGSCPGGRPGKIQALYDDIVACIRIKNISPETAFRLATENVAKVLKLYPKKGVLQPGGDADILITDENYTLQKLFGRGTLLFDRAAV